MDYQNLEAFAERSRRADEQTALIAGLPQWFARAVVYLVMAVIAITLAILYFGRVQTVVETRGTILPGTLVRLQAQQSGVVTEVLVSPGTYLEAGAVVLRVDASGAGLALAQARLAREADEDQLRVLRASRDWLARMRAQPDAVSGAAGAGALAASTYDAISRLEDARLQLTAADAKQALVPERRQRLEAQASITEARLALLQRSPAGSAQPGQVQVEIGAAELELAELRTALRTIESDARVEAATARTRYDQALANLQREYDTTVVKVRDLESKIALTNRQMSGGAGTAAPAAITMPEAGTIAALDVHAAGDIVTAGSHVATIVPKSAPLRVEVTATNKDVAFVRPGMDARIKVDAFPFQQFGTARAQVTKILPGAGATASFVVQLDLQDQALVADGAEHRLFPGLTVQADLVTGRQRLLGVLLHGRAGSGAEK